MITRPCFKPHFHVETVAPRHVFLLTETRSFVLEGQAYRHLAPLIDGTRTTGEILEAIDGIVVPAEARYALDLLERRGYLTEADEPGERADRAFWHQLGIDPRVVAERLAAARVGVVALGAVDESAVVGALAGVGIPDRGVDTDLRVVLVADYEEPALEAVNREAIATGQSWLLAKTVGAQIWVGPLFVPGQTACWQCLATRLRENRQVERFVLERTGRSGPLPTSRAATPASRRAAAGLIATEVVRWIGAGRPAPARAEIVTLDLVALETARHVVVRRPTCACCGTALLDEPGPIQLVPRRKRYTADGGHRVCTPDDTLARLAHHVSPITGVVTSLLRKDAQENGLTFSYAAGHAFVAANDPSVLKANLRFRSGGKGMSDTQARVSGICEAIERYSGVWRGDQPRVRASAISLGDQAVSLRDVLLFSDRQYDTRREWNHGCSPTQYHVVPDPFDDQREIDWSAVWSLTAGRTRYLPSAYCYYGHPESERFFCATDANGTAAGNTIEEAILQGLFELIERDAVAVWWYNRLNRPHVGLESFRLPYTSALKRHYQAIGRELWVLDLTHDLGIPVFAACSRRIDRPVEDIVVSFGAHVDPTIALTRSLTETNQFLPALSLTNPDGSTRYAYEDPDAIHWWKTATLANQPYLAPQAGAGSRWRDFPMHSSDDIAADVRWVVARLAEHGLETLVLDQTRPEIGHPTVRVVVPGLRHFWRRLGPGRLYDVPVKLGWLPSPRDEADLNPLSMFF